MKILFICNDLEYFLVHRVFMAEAMVTEGHEVHVCAGMHHSVDVQAELPSITFHPIEISKHRLAIWQDIGLIRRFRNLILDSNFDIVHTITIKPNLFASVALTAVRFLTPRRKRPGLVMTFPGLGKVYEPGSGISGLLRRSVVTSILSITKRVLKPIATFENHETRAQLVRSGVVEQGRTYVMLGAGINREQFFAAKRAGSPKILYAGRLLRAKGVETFVAVARKLGEKFPEAEFMVAGAIEAKNPDAIDPSVLENAAQRGEVTYLRFVLPNEIPALLRRVDVLCVPTRLKEGFPRVILEAAACGCAVIATHQKVVELIIEDGETGWFIDPPDEDNLTSAVAEALSNVEQTRAMGQQAAQRIDELPVYETDIVNQTRYIYRELSEET